MRQLTFVLILMPNVRILPLRWIRSGCLINPLLHAFRRSLIIIAGVGRVTLLRF